MGSLLTTIKALFELISMAKGFAQMARENSNERWWVEFNKAMKGLNEAKTQEERKRAISDYARVLADLG